MLAFSILPRIVIIGTQKADLLAYGELAFQYPTPDRGHWNVAQLDSGICVPRAFSILPRIVVIGTCSTAARSSTYLRLSVSYPGSWSLEPMPHPRQQDPTHAPFSILLRIVVIGTAQRAKVRRRQHRAFSILLRIVVIGTRPGLRVLDREIVHVTGGIVCQ